MHGRIKYTPRWIGTQVVLPPRSDTTTLGVVELEPTRFVNDTIWNWELEHLSFFAPQQATAYGGVATSIEARIGMSGQSDINLVDGPLSILAGNTNMQDLKGRYVDTAGMFVHKLKRPYRLSKDNGFRIRIKQNDYRWGFFAYGRGVDSGKPYTFMGLSDDLSQFGEDEYYSVDVMNTGLEDVDIDRLGFDEVYNSYSTTTQFMVNPIVGVKWMPGEVEMPAKLIAPYTAFAPAANGDNALNKAQAIQFPEGTKLRRRQRLRIRLRNTDTTNNVAVYIALFGYMEVK